MPNALDLDQPSAFEEVLRYLGRPAYSVRNIATGNLGGALRQGADLVGDTVDAFLPGDLIPELSQQEDSPEFSDMLAKWGAPKMDPGLLKTGVDILGGIATDPLTYVGTGLFTTPLKAAASSARTGISKIPKGAEALAKMDSGIDSTSAFVKRLAGAEKLSPVARDAIDALNNTSSTAGEVAAAGAREALSGLAPEDLEAFGKIMRNVSQDGERVLVPSVPNTARAVQTQKVLERLEPYQSPGSVPLAEDVYKGVTKPTRVEELSDLDQMLGRAPQKGAAADPTQYAVRPIEGKFSSGVDIANDPFLTDLPIPRIKGSTPIGPVVKGAVNVPEDFATLFKRNAETVSTPGSTPDAVAGMLGATGIPRAAREGVDLVKNPGEAAAFTSGMSKTVPEMVRVAPDDLEKALFTNRGERDQVINGILARVDASGLPPEQAARLKEAIPKYVDLKHQQWQERIRRGVMSVGPGESAAKSFADYMPRMLKEEDDLGKIFAQSGSGSLSTAMARQYPTEEAYMAAIKASGKTPEYDIAKVEGKYAQQQAGLLGKAEFAKVLSGPFIASAEEKLANAGKSIEKWTQMDAKERLELVGLTPAERAALDAKGASLFGMENGPALKDAIPKIIDEIALTDRASADALARAWSGLPGRGGFEQALAMVNNKFKPFATAGAFIPRINFNTRNIVGGMFQVLSNPAARAQWPKYARESADMLWGSVNDGINHILGRRIASEDIFKQLNTAIKGANGSLDNAINALPPGSMQEALRHGVIANTFADSELLSKEIAKSGWRKIYADLRDWPAKIAQGAEMRMRFSVFDGLLKSGMDPKQAAQVVSDTFYDYAYNSVANRRARDIIPFFQFTAKAVPQVVKAMKDNPFLIPATRPLFTQDDAGENPLPPWLQKQVAIPLGDAPNGNPTYLTSLGLPIEVLSSLPNPSVDIGQLGRQLRQNVVGSANPALKTVYSVFTGEDPYFGTKWGSYDKAPGIAQALGADERSDAAALYNMLAGTGVIQPIASPISTLSSLFSPDESTGASLLNTLTGAKVKTVDEQAALRQLLSDYLAASPDVQSYQSFYQQSKDPEIQALMKQLLQVKQAMKERKLSEAAAPAAPP